MVMCSEYKTTLIEYLIEAQEAIITGDHDLLRPYKQFEKHIEDCNGCRRELENFRDIEIAIMLGPSDPELRERLDQELGKPQ